MTPENNDMTPRQARQAQIDQWEQAHGFHYRTDPEYRARETDAAIARDEIDAYAADGFMSATRDDYLDGLHGAELEESMNAHDIGDVKPSILDDADRIGGANWMRDRLAMVAAQARTEPAETAGSATADLVLPMIADFLAGDVADLKEFLERTDITDEQRRRARTVRALLEVAAWHMSAPDLPPLKAISVVHAADSIEQVAEYAKLHKTEPYDFEPRQCSIGTSIRIEGVYTPISVRFDGPKGETL